MKNNRYSMLLALILGTTSLFGAASSGERLQEDETVTSEGSAFARLEEAYEKKHGKVPSNWGTIKETIATDDYAAKSSLGTVAPALKTYLNYAGISTEINAEEFNQAWMDSLVQLVHALKKGTFSTWNLDQALTNNNKDGLLKNSLSTDSPLKTAIAIYFIKDIYNLEIPQWALEDALGQLKSLWENPTSRNRHLSQYRIIFGEALAANNPFFATLKKEGNQLPSALLTQTELVNGVLNKISPTLASNSQLLQQLWIDALAELVEKTKNNKYTLAKSLQNAYAFAGGDLGLLERSLNAKAETYPLQVAIAFYLTNTFYGYPITSDVIIKATEVHQTNQFTPNIFTLLVNKQDKAGALKLASYSGGPTQENYFFYKLADEDTYNMPINLDVAKTIVNTWKDTFIANTIKPNAAAVKEALSNRVKDKTEKDAFNTYWNATITTSATPAATPAEAEEPVTPEQPTTTEETATAPKVTGPIAEEQAEAERFRLLEEQKTQDLQTISNFINNKDVKDAINIAQELAPNTKQTDTKLNDVDKNNLEAAGITDYDLTLILNQITNLANLVDQITTLQERLTSASGQDIGPLLLKNQTTKFTGTRDEKRLSDYLPAKLQSITTQSGLMGSQEGQATSLARLLIKVNDYKAAQEGSQREEQEAARQQQQADEARRAQEQERREQEQRETGEREAQELMQRAEGAHDNLLQAIGRTEKLSTRIKEILAKAQEIQNPNDAITQITRELENNQTTVNTNLGFLRNINTPLAEAIREQKSDDIDAALQQADGNSGAITKLEAENEAIFKSLPATEERINEFIAGREFDAQEKARREAEETGHREEIARQQQGQGQMSEAAQKMTAEAKKALLDTVEPILVQVQLFTTLVDETGKKMDGLPETPELTRIFENLKGMRKLATEWTTLLTNDISYAQNTRDDAIKIQTFIHSNVINHKWSPANITIQIRTDTDRIETFNQVIDRAKAEQIEKEQEEKRTGQKPPIEQTEEPEIVEELRGEQAITAANINDVWKAVSQGKRQLSNEQAASLIEQASKTITKGMTPEEAFLIRRAYQLIRANPKALQGLELTSELKQKLQNIMRSRR